MAPSCPLGPFHREGRSSSCFTLTGVKGKSISYAVHVNSDRHQQNCQNVKLASTQFPFGRAHRSKVSTVASLTSVLLLALADTAQASSKLAFEKHCIQKWEVVRERLIRRTYNPLSTINENVLKAFSELAGNFEGSKKILNGRATATCTITPDRRSRNGLVLGTVKYEAGQSSMRERDYQRLELIGLTESGDVVQTPVLRAKDDKKITWDVFPVINNDLKETRVLAFVKNIQSFNEATDVFFYKWESSLPLNDVQCDRSENGGSHRSISSRRSSQGNSRTRGERALSVDSVQEMAIGIFSKMDRDEFYCDEAAFWAVVHPQYLIEELGRTKYNPQESEQVQKALIEIMDDLCHDEMMEKKGDLSDRRIMDRLHYNQTTKEG